MQIVRTAVWVVILIALLLFALNNWTPVQVKIWEGLVLETKLSALVIVAFLLGMLPTWLISRIGRWRLTRRIGALENSVRASAVPPPASPPGPPIATSTQLEAQASTNPPESANSPDSPVA
jgi:lipopolysaccharide assembly protein A